MTILDQPAVARLPDCPTWCHGSHGPDPVAPDEPVLHYETRRDVLRLSQDQPHPEWMPDASPVTASVLRSREAGVDTVHIELGEPRHK